MLMMLERKSNNKAPRARKKFSAEETMKMRAAKASSYESC